MKKFSEYLPLLKGKISYIKDPKNRKILITALLVIIILIFTKNIFFKKGEAHKVPARPVEIGVSVKKSVPVYINSFGNLTPPVDVNIKPQVDGEIKEIRFKEGEDVKKNDILFVIDPAPYHAELEKAEAQVVQDEADLNLKKTTLERYKQLVKDQLVSQQDYDKFATDAAQAEAKLQLDRASVDIAKINLDYCYIKSPIDGRTGKILVDLGNIVTKAQGQTLVNIKTIDPMYIDFTIPERYFPKVNEAAAKDVCKVQFKVQGDNVNTYSGTLKFLDNTVNNATGTVMLRAIVPNPDKKLWAGQFANIQLILGTQADAILVPFEAVKIGQDGAYIFVVAEDNTAELRSVTAGLKQDDMIVVETGLVEGERVVTSGQMGLSPGVPVFDISKAPAEKGKK